MLPWDIHEKNLQEFLIWHSDSKPIFQIKSGQIFAEIQYTQYFQKIKC